MDGENQLLMFIAKCYDDDDDDDNIGELKT